MRDYSRNIYYIFIYFGIQTERPLIQQDFFLRETINIKICLFYMQIDVNQWTAIIMAIERNSYYL